MISSWWLLLIVPVAVSVGFVAGVGYVVEDIFGD